MVIRENGAETQEVVAQARVEKLLLNQCHMKVLLRFFLQLHYYVLCFILMFPSTIMFTPIHNA